MESRVKHLVVALALLLAGVAVFFLLLYITGHDPDERPLTLMEWVVAGILVAPGFGYLVKWRKANDS